MTSYDPIWLAMVLGAQARIRPLTHITVHHGDHEPGAAYSELKKAIDARSAVDVNILDVGPAEAERRRQLAQSLEQTDVGNAAEVQEWAAIVLESVLKYTPDAIEAADFSPDEVRDTLQTLREDESGAA
jgi:hypothetical protein